MLQAPTKRELTLALNTAALTRVPRSAPGRSGQRLGLLPSTVSPSLAVQGQHRSPWFGETRPPTKSGGRGQSLGDWEWDGCLEAPATEGARGLSLQVTPQGSISILPLLPQFKCILVITSLITAKAICVHPPAKTACCLAGIPAPLLRENDGSLTPLRALAAPRSPGHGAEPPPGGSQGISLPQYSRFNGPRLTWPTGPTGSTKYKVYIRHVVSLSDSSRA